MKMDEELCFACGDPTGRAGRGEDSIYCDHCGSGPWCFECFSGGRDHIQEGLCFLCRDPALDEETLGGLPSVDEAERGAA